MRKAFDGSEANFTGVAESGEIFLRIGGVYQRAFVQIEEKGGRGAAVDSSGLVGLCSEPCFNFARFVVPYPRVIGTNKRAKSFIVERPFLFYLRKNGLTFLIGRITRPEFTCF